MSKKMIIKKLVEVVALLVEEIKEEKELESGGISDDVMSATTWTTIPSSGADADSSADVAPVVNDPISAPATSTEDTPNENTETASVDSTAPVADIATPIVDPSAAVQAQVYGDRNPAYFYLRGYVPSLQPLDKGSVDLDNGTFSFGQLILKIGDGGVYNCYGERLLSDKQAVISVNKNTVDTHTIEIKAKVDTTELDAATAKVKELVKGLEKVNSLLDSLAGRHKPIVTHFNINVTGMTTDQIKTAIANSHNTLSEIITKNTLR